MARKIFFFHCILSLCVMPSVIEAVSLCDDDLGTRSPSLYEQYCCVEGNKGKSIILTGEESSNIQVYMCPPETPASCSTLNLSPSCAGILTYKPTATSGYYNITQTDGTVIPIYCDMEGVNCDGEGGWMRVGHLNMSDPSEQCLPGFRLYEENGIRACGRQSSGCQSVEFPSHNINYSQVCGRVIGYQKGTPDAFYPLSINQGPAQVIINQPYVDGVSITRGSPRTHIWTYATAIQENEFVQGGFLVCPFAPNSPMINLYFVGNDYSCESGNPGGGNSGTSFYYNDPLWDGKQCGQIEEASCNVTGIPWFNKVLEQPTTDYIELRVCADEEIVNEDVYVSFFELFIK